jgi:hypothetical protein
MSRYPMAGRLMRPRRILSRKMKSVRGSSRKRRRMRGKRHTVLYWNTKHRFSTLTFYLLSWYKERSKDIS